MGDSTPPHPLDQTSCFQLKLIMQKGTLSSAHGIYLVVFPTLVMGCWFLRSAEALLPVAGVHVDGDWPRIYILHVETQHAASLQPPTMRPSKKNLPQAWNFREFMRIGSLRAAGGHAGRSFRSSKCQYPGICFAKRQELLIE